MFKVSFHFLIKLYNPLPARVKGFFPKKNFGNLYSPFIFSIDIDINDNCTFLLFFFFFNLKFGNMILILGNSLPSNQFGKILLQPTMGN